LYSNSLNFKESKSEVCENKALHRSVIELSHTKTTLSQSCLQAPSIKYYIPNILITKHCKTVFVSHVQLHCSRRSVMCIARCSCTLVQGITACGSWREVDFY